MRPPLWSAYLMELKCVKVYTEEVQSHFSPRAAIRYRYYRCLRSSARFNLTCHDREPTDVLLRAAFCLHPSMAFSSLSNDDATAAGIADAGHRCRDVFARGMCALTAFFSEEHDNMWRAFDDNSRMYYYITMARVNNTFHFNGIISR